ncbi:uncharacterized protein MKZ38_007466 [Zalerion maritima]|uniref:Uncharacterized protein n=1 Tax=Zalerion maritima TaxID=339359 RepID=A0AAD5WP60_9PEZI|nr:uncharacterized protein MKZ38_007466 [Zalerion maritima]
MKALLSSTEPLRQAIICRLPANRAVLRLMIGAAIITALLFLLHLEQPSSLCSPGSKLCFSSPEQATFAQDPSEDTSTPGTSASNHQNSQGNQPEAGPATETEVVEPGMEPTTTLVVAAKTIEPVSEPTKKPESEWHEAINAPSDFDPNDLTIGKEACYVSFPRILDDVKRPWMHFADLGIIDDEVNWIDLTEGRMKLSIVDKKILIHDVNLPTVKMRADALATLQSLHDALNSTDEVFNSIDFVMDVKDKVPDVNDPVWVFTRRFQENRTWLMPSSNFLFGFHPDRVSSTYVNAVEKGAAAARIVVDSSKAKLTRQFVSQPQLGNMGPTRERFIANVQEYEQSVEFEEKITRAVATWPSGHPPGGRNPTKAFLDDQLFGEEWGIHTDPRDKSSGIEGYGKDVDVEKDPGRALCQHKYIIWDESFGSNYIDSVGICGSVVFRGKSDWIDLYSELTMADAGFDAGSRKPYRPSQDPVLGRWHDGTHITQMIKHNLVYVRTDMQDVKYKIQALEKMSAYARSIAENQAKTYRKRYLTRAAAACYWRTLVRAYGDIYSSIKYEKYDF